MRQEWIYSLSWVAGVITWFAVGIPMGAGLLDGSISLSSPAIAVWFACYVGFGLLFGIFASDLLERFSNRIHQAALWLEIVFASVALLVYPHYSTAAILFILTAVHAINLWTLGQSLLLIGGQTLLMLVAFIPTDANWVKTSMTVLAYMAFQFFALISTEIAQREARAKKELAKLNAELSAAQALLSESSKVSERVRIARELHDILGHQLTALSLNLEIASHTEGEKARGHLHKAQQIAKDLLLDVRGVVSTMRDSHVNLDMALRALVEGVPKPAIHLVLEPGLAIDDPQKAHTLVRCVQEVSPTPCGTRARKTCGSGWSNRRAASPSMPATTGGGARASKAATGSRACASGWSSLAAGSACTASPARALGWMRCCPPEAEVEGRRPNQPWSLQPRFGQASDLRL